MLLSRTTRAASVFMWLFLMPSCQQSAKDVTVTISPAKPVVINVPVTINSGTDYEVTYSENWFKIRLTLTNNRTTESLTVVSIKLTVRNGEEEAECDINNENLPDGSPAYLAELDPSETESLAYDFYCSGLFADNQDNFGYSVTGEVSGWIGTYDTPIGRASGTFNFSTQ